MGEHLVWSIIVLFLHHVKQIFPDHPVAHLHAGQGQDGFGQALGAHKLLDRYTAPERTARDNKRHMQAGVVAGTLVIIIAVEVAVRVPGLEMGAVIRGENDDGIVVQPFFLKPCHNPPQIFIETGALPQIIGVFLRGVAPQNLQILWKDEILVFFL